MSKTSISIPILQHFYDQADNGSKPTESSLPLETSRPEDFTSLNNRLKTFDTWRNTELSKYSLAEAGFVYTGKDDIVICPFCKVEGFRWVTGDKPMADHRLWSPNCPYLRNNSEHDHTENNSNNIDTCGLYGVEVVPNSVPEESRKIDLQRLGIQKSIGPQYQDKITYESRFATFQKWPKAIKQRPADLAEAGFYYTGVGDQTLCFHCGGGLKDWEEDDDPWEQHALWFSKCVFLNLKKGPEFVKKVKEENEPERSVPGTSGSSQTKDEPTETLSEKCEKFSIKDSEAAEKTLCKICYKNELGVVFLPCGHIVACVDCAAALKNCAVCRKPLEATVRAFLS